MDNDNQHIDEIESPEKNQPVPQAQEHPADQQFSNEQQHEMYEQQDDGQYYDDGEGGGKGYYDEYEEADEVTAHLKETRLNKKKAADDAKLLANRIALLKMEERKAWKKIQETKRKAEQVMQVRQRNEEDRMRKEQFRQLRENEEEARLMKNQQEKESRKMAVAQNNQHKQLKQLNDANQLKVQSQKNNLMIRRQKEAEMMKNASIKEMIRKQKLDASDRRDFEVRDKKQQQRNRLINSILEENNKRMEIEQKVADLEKDEYELIQRLQNTSNIQKQAYEDLECALNGQLSPDQLEAQFGLNSAAAAKLNNGSRMGNSKGFKK